MGRTNCTTDPATMPTTEELVAKAEQFQTRGFSAAGKDTAGVKQEFTDASPQLRADSKVRLRTGTPFGVVTA